MDGRCIIQANPDIAGVGVRAAIYAQVIIALVPPVLSTLEFPFWLPSNAPIVAINRVQTTAFSIILTGTALLIAAFIQASTLGLSVYHATIVLNLSWLNNITACAVLSFRWMLDNHQLRGTTNWQRIRSKEFAAYTLHLSATGALGLWLFSNVPGFDIMKQCSDSTVQYVFGRYPRVAAPAYRITWLVVYILAAIPLLNWILACFLLMMTYTVIFIGTSLFGLLIFVCSFCCCAACIPGCRRWIENWSPSEPVEEDNPPDKGYWRVVLRVYPIGWVLFILAIDIGLVISTEQTIRHNRVGPGEGQWTFGQTLALLVVIFPILDLWRQVKGMWNSRRGGLEGDAVDQTV